MIERRLYPELDLVVHRVVGAVDPADFQAMGAALYALDPPPRFSLWDLSHASVDGLDLSGLRSLQAGVAGKVHGRDGGRTAVVAGDDVRYGVARQYASLADSLGLPFEHQVFRTRAEALDWLGIQPDEVGEP